VKRILLDENMPRLLRRELRGFEVVTVVEAGWAGKRNGELLRLAAAEFDVLLSCDRNIPHQQVVSSVQIGVVIIAAGGLKLQHILPHVAAIRDAAEIVQPGEILYVP
jgi:hypothetical protein